MTSFSIVLFLVVSILYLSLLSNLVLAEIVEAGQLAALDALTDANNGPIFNFVNVTVRARSIVDLCSSSMHRPIHTYIF